MQAGSQGGILQFPTPRAMIPPEHTRVYRLARGNGPSQDIHSFALGLAENDQCVEFPGLVARAYADASGIRIAVRDADTDSIVGFGAAVPVSDKQGLASALAVHRFGPMVQSTLEQGRCWAFSVGVYGGTQRRGVGSLIARHIGEGIRASGGSRVFCAVPSRATWLIARLHAVGFKDDNARSGIHSRLLMSASIAVLR